MYKLYFHIVFFNSLFTQEIKFNEDGVKEPEILNKKPPLKLVYSLR